MIMDDNTERTITHASFTIERNYPQSAARVFQAFADPATKRRWFAEGGGPDAHSYELDFRVGGREVGLFRVSTPEFSSEEIRNDTVYFDIVPERRIVFGYSMANVGVPFSASLVTIELEPGDGGGGTKLTFTEQVAFFEGSDGVDMRRSGTSSLLDALERELAAG